MAKKQQSNSQPKGLQYTAEFASDKSNDAKLLQRIMEITKRPAVPRKVG